VVVIVGSVYEARNIYFDTSRVGSGLRPLLRGAVSRKVWSSVLEI
jgi:hypothetical protein